MFNKTHSVTELNRVKHSTYQHLLSNPAEPDQGRMCFIKHTPRMTSPYISNMLQGIIPVLSESQ